MREGVLLEKVLCERVVMRENVPLERGGLCEKGCHVREGGTLEFVGYTT